MEHNKVQVSLEEMLYYILFATILFTKGVGLDEGSLLFRSCLMLGLLLLAWKFLIGQYSIGEIVLAGILGIWGVFTFKVTGSLGMFIYVVLIIGMKNVSVRRVFAVGTIVWSACMLYTVTAAIFWGRTGARVVHEKFGLGPILRESLGYTHPNVLHITFILWMVFILYFCAGNKKKTFYAICLLLLGNVYIFMYSLSSTGILTVAVLLVLFFYFLRRKNFSRAELLVIQGMPILCTVFSIVFPLAAGESMLYQIVNKIFNNRIWAIRTFFRFYNVTLFGGGNEGIDFSLDNSYINALNAYGAIPLILMTAAYTLLMRYCIKKNMRMELTIICTFLIAGISEPFLVNASIKNITVIFLGEFLYTAMRKENCAFKFLSKCNKTFLFSYDIWERGREWLYKIKWKSVACIIMAVGILCFLLFPLGNRPKINEVYIEEKWCWDIGGETMRLPDMSVMDGTQYIERISPDANYYYFTRENSHLIEIMDLRFRVSVSLYVAVIAGILYILVKEGFGKRLAKA